MVTNYSNQIKKVWSQNEYDAFVSLAYNSGYSFKYVMDQIVGGTDAYSAFSTIVYSNGIYSQGLWNRRMDEATIFLYGKYEHAYRDGKK